MKRPLCQVALTSVVGVGMIMLRGRSSLRGAREGLGVGVTARVSRTVMEEE